MHDGVSTPSESSTRRVYRYGDFPELFWDAQPDAVIEPGNRVMLARVITHGSMDAIRKLVSPEVLRRSLSTLPVPEHRRRFWQRVLDTPTYAGAASWNGGERLAAGES